MITHTVLYILPDALFPFSPLLVSYPSSILDMELELSLGDSRAPAKSASTPAALTPIHAGAGGEGHELALELGVGAAKRAEQDNQKTPVQPEHVQEEEEEEETCPYSESPAELSLIGCPLLPAASAEIGSVNSSEVCVRRGFGVDAVLVDGGDAAQGRPALSTSFLPSEFLVRRQADDQEAAAEDEEMSGVGGGARKKLRLSKEQSAFLEDSFKAHSTLTPKQKSDLAKRLKLRPRQVEVWFQNRRARSKLKQTEVDCEYLKRWCEKLAQENRRLQREVAELRRLCSAAYPFYGAAAGFGVATARVCPSSCDNDVSEAAISGAPSAAAPPPSTLFASWPPHFGPFTVVVPPLLRRQPSATTS
ncbi:homeobox-leucine zipper protein HOX7 isoform X1 [Zea mays]|nr:homeobox-leucine zipper protein HOX7 isoform X1 [Zea mays]|eukprot:XP_008678710.1 homeobox-leucine zipper protein HOX7 [Zea mays]